MLFLLSDLKESVYKEVSDKSAGADIEDILAAAEKLLKQRIREMGGDPNSFTLEELSFVSDLSSKAVLGGKLH
jgi:hypothetical protein